MPASLEVLAVIQTTADCSRKSVWMTKIKPTQCDCFPLLSATLDGVQRRYWHWQLYSMFYGPYRCLPAQLLLWFVETDECRRPTVEHKLPLAPQCAAPTCEIFQSAGLGATFVNAIQLLPGLRGLLTAFKYDNFHIQSCFSNCFMDTVTIRWKKICCRRRMLFIF